MSSRVALALAFVVGGVVATKPSIPAKTAFAQRLTPVKQAICAQGLHKSFAAAVASSFLTFGAPELSHALAPPTTTVVAAGELDTNMDDLRPEQRKFLEERASKPQVTQYEKQVAGTFKSKEATEGGKFKYGSVVTLLLVVSVVAPMATYFYYVKEEDE